MPRCPAGHASASTDYCDDCGLRVGAPTPPPEPAAAAPCVVCGEPVDGLFCETCGHRRGRPAPSSDGWHAVVSADRVWFEEVRGRGGLDAGGLTFPPDVGERVIVLTGAAMTIGRGSPGCGVEPDIDLGRPPADPGVSTRHGELRARPDRTWELVDLGSTNGTQLDRAPQPLRPGSPVPLVDGDRIWLGAWTTITIRQSR